MISLFYRLKNLLVKTKQKKKFSDADAEYEFFQDGGTRLE